MTLEKARHLRELIKKAVASLDDEDAMEAVELFPVWHPGVAFERGVRVRYGDKLYRCEQTHTPQEGWEPPNVPALWTEVAKPGEIPVWRQPTGAQDAYAKGDKVRYPDEYSPVYESVIDANVWSPEVYPAGWKLVEG